MTLSLVAVFIPVLFLGGLIGRLFQEFAVTIGVAILVSGFVSLTLTPMLCSRWLKPEREQAQHGRFYQVIERRLGAARSPGTSARLAWVMDRRGLAHGVQRWCILIGTVVLGRDRAEGVHPERGPGQLNGTTETAEGTSFDAMVQHQQRGRGDRAGGPERRGIHVVGRAGGRSTAINQGRLFIHLKPREPAHAERRRGGPLAHPEAGGGARACGCSSPIRRRSTSAAG